jgi:hypothetical protein
VAEKNARHDLLERVMYSTIRRRYFVTVSMDEM